MGHERWFRGRHDGQGRPFDWLTAARQHGIPDKLARALYEQAVRQAHGGTQGRVQEVYLSLLLDARRDAVRPSPGKVTRTMRLQAHQAGKRRRPYTSRLTGQPIAPGKCTLTSYLEPASAERRSPEKEGEVGRLSEQDISVPDTLSERRLQAYLAAAAGHFEELDALGEIRTAADPASAAEAAKPNGDTEAAEVNGWQLPAELQLRLESLVGAGRSVEGWGVAAPMQAAGLQGTPEAARPPGYGSGEAMPEDVRRKMEAAFGVDFSAVRIHQGPHAEAVGARAYTQGTDIHFAPGQYQPQSQRGLELLGHELTHVVQQSQGRVQPTTRADGINVNADASLEREANEMGAWVARGEGAREPSPWPDGIRLDGPFNQQSDANPAFVVTSEGNPSLQVARRDAAPRPRNELQQSDSAHGEVQQRALDDVPETQRHTIIVSNAVEGFPAGQIEEWFFLPRGRSQPVAIRRPDDEMTFSGGLRQAPENIRTGLGTVAMSLISSTIEGRNGAPARSLLAVGTTLEVNLMLEPYGGQNGRYRFTRYRADAQTTIVVELVGSIPAAAAEEQVPASPFPVGASTFRLENAWNPADYALLREALELLPSAALRAADGLRFRRMTGSARGSEAGRYQTASDTIELFQEVFTTRDPRGRAREPRTCTGGRREGVFLVLHEIAHALDLRQFSASWRDAEEAFAHYRSADQELQRLRGTPSASASDALLDDLDAPFPPEAPARASPEEIRHAQQRRETAREALEQARRRLMEARSQSGYHAVVQPDGNLRDMIGRHDGEGTFQAAAQADGVRPAESGQTTAEGTTATLSRGPTTYSNTDYGELYADSFALYILDPDLLRAIRPRIFAYFAGLYPR